MDIGQLSRLPDYLVCSILYRLPYDDIERLAVTPEYTEYIRACFRRLGFRAMTVVPWEVIRSFSPLESLRNVMVELPVDFVPIFYDIHAQLQKLADVTLALRVPITARTAADLVDLIASIPDRKTTYRILMRTRGVTWQWAVIEPNKGPKGEDWSISTTQTTTPFVPNNRSRSLFTLYGLAAGGRRSTRYDYLFRDLTLPPPTRGQRAVGLVGPMAWWFFYQADLGLVDPTRPGGPDNPRLIDNLRIFTTAATRDSLHLLMGIAMGIIVLRLSVSQASETWDRFVGGLWGPIFGPWGEGIERAIEQGEYITDVPDHVRAYADNLRIWARRGNRKPSTLLWLQSAMLAQTPWSSPRSPGLEVPMARLLYLPQEIYDVEAPYLVTPRPYGNETFEESADADERLIRATYRAYTDAVAQERNVYVE